MSLTPKEAVESLTQAEEARRKSSQLYFYRRSSPHLIMWGVIWIIGYGGTGLFPHYASKLWIALIVLACIGGVIISRRCKSDSHVIGPNAWRLAALWVIVLFFVVATYAILQPQFGKQFAAYPALITGCAYMAAGLWIGLRYVLSGIAVVVLTLVGYFYIEPVHLWFAVVGGGAMILTGVWFRTV